MKISGLKQTIFLSAMIFSLHALAIVTPPQPSRTANDLTKQYHNSSSNCGSANKPAFLCSGIMLRGTVPSNLYHSWDPSPASVTSGGVSFSYLRKDAKFNRLAYGYKNGFIIYPHNNTPTNLLKIEVLCSFPLDGDTINRSAKGCGANTAYPASSKACQSMGIRTAGAWSNHYKSVSNNPRQHQCAFDVRSSVSGNADYFSASIKARAYIASESFKEQNEIRLATWSQGIASKLPIQAFFYVNNGLSNAQFDQRDYYNQTGLFIPIIKLTLPTNSSADAKFNFYKSDQVVQN
ncbi:N-acyl homoserine lactonase [Yersinia enterocolitica]|uniref:N-acyl homoserine lactonase n=1 Tax=Yersinia enterocolitica TaxID=630 RepID=UPI00398D078E